MESIKAELERLSASGFKEIVLTGINLSCYDDNGKKLIDVIEMADNVNGIERIRLGSLDPEVVTEDFVERLGKVKKICPHFHFSLQSGCDKTLKAMNRHYTSDEYYEKCQLIRKYIDNPAFTTDVIVGFPGETEEDFEDTLDVVRKVRYDSAYTFIYSKRTGTPAAAMENQVPEEVVKERFDRLLHEVQGISSEITKSIEGETVPVLVEEINTQNEELLTGRLSNNAVVHFPGDASLIGEILPVKLVESKGFYYMGEIVR